MKCKYCNSEMVEFLIDKFICINDRCEKANLIQAYNEDNEEID